ncbi:MAG: LuxR family transcriptional regulator [Paracoccaceae bacterium]|nr:LuxR family transcriptional regulator [Paracoccaceae bacterium]
MQPVADAAVTDFPREIAIGDLLGFLEKVTAATSVENVWTELTATMARHGFDRLIYGFTRFRTARSLGDPDDHLILTNHDRAYTDRFVGERLYQQAPMIRWAANNTGSCSWSWIEDQAEKLTAAELRVVEYNRQMGVVAGYSISFPALSQRARGVLALTAREGLTQDEADAIWDRHGGALQQMATVAHLKITTLPHSGGRRPLTDRQREVLEWVGDGKTTQDIALLLGLTPATVEKHLRLAREALDVETTAQAVLKASFQNQIFVLRPRGSGF